MWDIRKILIPVDGSNHSDLAAQFAIDVAKRHEAEIIVLSVIDIPHHYLAKNLFDTLKKNIAEPAVERVLKYAEEKGIKATPLILEGHPAETIVKIACEQKVDLIIMGTRGASFMRKFLIGLGSVAQSVLAHSPCPVLVFKGEWKECEEIKDREKEGSKH